MADNTEWSKGTDSGSVVDSAKEAASHVMDQVKDHATIRADQQRQTVASGFVSVAEAVRRMSDGLREHDQGPVAHYAAELGHALGDKAERAANYLRERDVRQLVSDTEGFARRSPSTFLGTAFLLGLAASRFLKSSRPVPMYTPNRLDPSRALPPAHTPDPWAAPYASPASTPAPWTPASNPTPGFTTSPSTGSNPSSGAFGNGGSEDWRTSNPTKNY